MAWQEIVRFHSKTGLTYSAGISTLTIGFYIVMFAAPDSAISVFGFAMEFFAICLTIAQYVRISEPSRALREKTEKD